MRTKKEDEEDNLLVAFIKDLDWAKFLIYGSISIQLRDGKPTLVRVEKTIKLD